MDDLNASRLSSTSTPSRTELTNQLSAKLDAQRNEDVEHELQLENTTAHDVLTRVLSLTSQVSTMSSFAMNNMAQQTNLVGFRTIGFGQCGIIFERPGRGYAVKVSRPSFEEALWSDLKAHFAVFQAFEQQPDIAVRVPQIFSYVHRDNSEWWETHLPLFPDAHVTFPLPAMCLLTERILPLPKVARQALIDTYCPVSFRDVASSQDTNRDCLARIYLGRRRPTGHPPPANFTLRNFNLCLDQMIELGLPVYDYARAIAEALATIHWSANVDAYDVEFVLGSEAETGYTHDISRSLGLTRKILAAMPSQTDLESKISVNFKRCVTRIWVLDFNLCTTWEDRIGWEYPEQLVSQLVSAFFENDPYYPRPLSESEVEKKLWGQFSSAYLHTATGILSTKDSRFSALPQKFIDGCVLRQREMLQ
ncbi:uncharacterized protein N7515_006739 [Penicillium bovifimosum]|uniref:DUF3669 domain-containing protein n=1 Tax=Penicillium bovifimosum TaxID=126998 RepID=A0A9W9L1E5_9EURO|nr:uncharacterized protein N7515_006739 [Penicillium bovifimosum]KAJ5130700.1 hypothetical protein N7515_006739 [Penicillium bovifimosum]